MLHTPDITETRRVQREAIECHVCCEPILINEEYRHLEWNPSSEIQERTWSNEHLTCMNASSAFRDN